MKKIKKAFSRFLREAQELYSGNKKIIVTIGCTTFALGSIYLFSGWQDRETNVYHKERQIDFTGGKILEGQKGIYRRKELVLSKKVKNIETGQRTLIEQIKGLRTMFKDLQESQTIKKAGPSHLSQAKEVTFSPSPSGLSVASVNVTKKSISRKKKRTFSRRRSKGPSVISFPVQAKERAKGMTVKLPAGSFVRAKLLTGVEASESKAVPVLMQADYAFVGPNKTKIDLSGCFFLAKSKGNLSIERVEAQITTISCVSKSGRMFEKSVNGFITDAKDNSFAVMGSVNSKQDRVAVMAFLSSVVEGVGKAIQQAQTSNQTNAVGGTNSMITGSQGKYMAAGGVSNAAGLVTQWYLKHAQNLLPTINIGSGQDVWIVMQQSVALPNWYFKKAKNQSDGKDSYSYLSGLLN